jgi:hypothetical protein
LFADGDLVHTWTPPEGYVEASPPIVPEAPPPAQSSLSTSP